MRCPVCGNTNRELAQYCDRCSIKLVTDEPASFLCGAPMAKPVQEASNMRIPMPRVARLGVPTVPDFAETAVVATVNAANVNEEQAPRSQTHGTKYHAQNATARPQPLYIAAGVVVVCGILAFTSSWLVRLFNYAEPTFSDLENQDVAPSDPTEFSDSTTHGDSGTPEPPAVDQAEAGDAYQQLTDAINNDLESSGYVSVEVLVLANGVASVTGSVNSMEEHDEVIRWLQTLPGITETVDELQIEELAQAQ